MMNCDHMHEPGDVQPEEASVKRTDAELLALADAAAVDSCFACSYCYKSDGCAPSCSVRQYREAREESKESK
ncbi:hypothetical protein FJY70_00240 [candidate division WOR-3 bacterium]|nr:hypothetical protein [candidate division WOR-3 bacterium]